MSDLSIDHFSEPTGPVKGLAQSLKRRLAGPLLLKRQQAVVAMGRRVAASSELSVTS